MVFKINKNCYEIVCLTLKNTPELYDLTKMINFVIEEHQVICCPLEDITASNVSAMYDLLVQKLAEINHWELLVLDCQKVKILDSIGVNLIIGLCKKAKAVESVFKVSHCNESITKVLNLFKLDRQFLIE